jgi:hypothetical protein
MGRPKGCGKGFAKGKPFPMWERVKAFWSKVQKGKPNECWPWLGYTEKETGYGKFTWGGRSNSAHRFAWISTFGAIPPGLFVCHKCDNRICQNPNHLWLGTVTDNNRDMFGKGRGSNPPRHTKITETQVRQIRGMWVPYKRSIRSISQELGLPYKACESAVSHWRHIPWH